MTEKKEKSIQQRLVEAMWEMPNPPKNAMADTGKYKYHYATLDVLLDCIKPALKDHGLALIQRWHQNISCDGWNLQTSVISVDGDAMLVDERPIAVLARIQEQGSEETYTKRYALMTAFSLAGVEDIDANDIKDRERVTPEEAARRRLIAECQAYADETGESAKDVMRRIASDPDFKKTAEGYAKAVEKLKARRGQS